MNKFVNAPFNADGNPTKIGDYQLKNEQFQETFDWVLQLGLNRNCAQNLARIIVDHPVLNLEHYQKRWSTLAQRMGTNQLDLVDAMLLGEMRELLHKLPGTENNCKTPSPPNGIWNSFHGYNSIIEDNYSTRIITSTPLRHYPIEEPAVYNIHTDPRNTNDHIYQDQQNSFERNNPKRDKSSDYRYVNNSWNGNVPNIVAVQHYNDDIATNCSQINKYSKQLEQCKADSFNARNNRETDHKSTRKGRRLNFHLGTGDLDRPDFVNINNHPSRKRTADRIDGTNEPHMEHNHKRRLTDGSRQFNIGAFKMPYVKFRQCPLPQSEKKSHAIAFFQRKHCFIIGGPNTIRVDADKFTTQGMFNTGRSINKLIRRNIREKWNDKIVKHYDDWGNWWEDHKWCEDLINIELNKFRGVNVLQKTFLNLNFKKANSVHSLMELAQSALGMETNNFQTILSTIFEIKNWKFLEKLTIDEIGKLQDFIRYVPNKLWMNIMRSMVFLWRQYYEIQANLLPENERNRYATFGQWNSYIFHWLAKQAYDELKRISKIEWPPHKRVFSLAPNKNIHIENL